MLKKLLGISILLLVGCNNNSSNYTPTTYQSPNYQSSSFQNADPKAQEDVIIYDILRKNGYSDEESKRAVINSMK